MGYYILLFKQLFLQYSTSYERSYAVETKFYSMYIPLIVKVNITNKKQKCIVNFPSLKFDILNIKVCLLLYKLKKLLKK